MQNDTQQLPETITQPGKTDSTKSSSAPCNNHYNQNHQHQLRQQQPHQPQPQQHHRQSTQRRRSSANSNRQRRKSDQKHPDSIGYESTSSPDYQMPSTSSSCGIQMQSIQSPPIRSSNGEQIPMQSLHHVPDSPSLVKVKSWYTKSKSDVC